MKSFDSIAAARARVAILLGVLLAIGGCDGTRTPGDAGGQTDSGNPRADGGPADSGAHIDAGSRDAGTSDGGATDAGTLDGGASDGSTGSDGGGADAAADGGVADAGSDGGTCAGELTWFECTNGMDDDCDGVTDTDPGCSVCAPALAPEAGDESTDALCADGFDNDCNGYVDCEDFGCRGVAGCGDAENTDVLCMDGIDNDADGRIDCLQRACASTTACRPATMTTEDDDTLCGDGLDDDYDGRIDCDDDDCDGIGFCASEVTDTACNDGHDNDGDGNVDCRDGSCSDIAFCGGEDTDAACTNGTDDDHDGRIDCRDLGCLALAVCHDVETACDDGTDDDLDGNADCHDEDCASACAATACSDTNWFGTCTSPETCAEGVCARSLSSYSFPTDQPLLITEIMPDPTGISDANGEYFEVTNVSTDVIDIEGLGFVDGVATHEMTVGLTRVVMPNERVLFVHNTDSTANGGLMNGIGFTFDLNNGSGDAVAIRFGGTDIHRVTYPGTGNDLLNTGTSSAAGESISLDSTSMTWCLTPDDAANAYESSGANFGTPGAVNVSCTP